jgi:two-component system, NtrC family, response regulator AlgB
MDKMKTDVVKPLVASVQPLSVLVIDDERNIRTTLSMYLESMGHRVVSAASDKQAIAALAQSTFDLAFLDMRL